MLAISIWVASRNKDKEKERRGAASSDPNFGSDLRCDSERGNDNNSECFGLALTSCLEGRSNWKSGPC